jgi:hypothetical protein
MSENNKAGVHNPKVIDLVTHDPETDEFALIMIETRDWDGSPERLLQLQEKVNNYLSFALDGQMVKLYPESTGKSVRLQLDCNRLPDQDTLRFIEQLREHIKPLGIPFVVNVLD